MKSFGYLLSICSLSALLTGCGDQPYSASGGDPNQPGVPGGGGTTPVDPPMFASIHGTVDIGNPVSKAKISLHAFENAKLGKELGNSTTDSAGRYKIDISERFEGPCLLVSKGGDYVDPTTKRQVSIKETEILSAPIMGLKAVLNEVAINAWTTLASARTAASRNQYDTDEKAIKANLLLMSNHLKRDSEPEAILKSKAINLSVSGLKIDDFNLLSHLSHLGLSGLANNHYGISTAQLITVLATDLLDGQFDGNENTRSKLVLSIHEALKNIQKTEKLGFNPSGFLQQDGFFEQLSLDPNEKLYSDKDIPSHPEEVLKLPILHKLAIERIEELKPFDSIEVSAQIRSPHNVSQIDASLIQVKRPVICTSDFEKELIATGFPIEKLKTCQVSKEEETPVEIQTEVAKNGGQIHLSFTGLEGDTKKELTWKIIVTVHHINGNKVLFETEPFTLTKTPNPSMEPKHLSQLMSRSLAEQDINHDVVLEHLTKLSAGINLEDFKTSYRNYTERCNDADRIKGSDNRIKAFLKQGVAVDTVVNDNGDTLLHYAISKNCLGIAKTLMESKADIHIKTKQGETPFHAAIKVENPSIMGELINFGIKIDDVKDEHGKTFLDYAKESGKLKAHQFIEDVISKTAKTLAEANVEFRNVPKKNVLALAWELGRGGSSEMTIQEGQFYCSSKGLGWRLPTILELVVLYRQKNVLGKDISYDDEFWSSTPQSTSYGLGVGFIGKQWMVRFSDGAAFASDGHLKSGKYVHHVRCVRSLESNATEDAGLKTRSVNPGTIRTAAKASALNSVAELEWELFQRDLDRPRNVLDIESIEYITFDSAKAYCTEKKDSWRLPTVEELYALDQQKTAYLDKGEFWSSTPVTGKIDASYFVLRNGCEYRGYKSQYKARARCVREVKN